MVKFNYLQKQNISSESKKHWLAFQVSKRTDYIWVFLLSFDNLCDEILIFAFVIAIRVNETFNPFPG